MQILLQYVFLGDEIAGAWSIVGARYGKPMYGLYIVFSIPSLEYFHLLPLN
jgi:hypothetical protein